MHVSGCYRLVGKGRACSEPDGIRWRTGGEVKGKQAIGVGSQYNSTLPRNVVCPALLPLLLPIRTPRLPVVDWTDDPTDLNGLVRFGERRNLVSARVPSRSARAIPTMSFMYPPQELIYRRGIWWPRRPGVWTETINPEIWAMAIKALCYLSADMRRCSHHINTGQKRAGRGMFCSESGREFCEEFGNKPQS